MAMREPRFWSLRTTWEPLPSEGSARHAVDVPELVVAKLEAGRRWSGRKPGEFHSSRGRKLEDFPWCFAPVWSLRAVEAVRPLLEDCGEFLPVAVRRGSVTVRQQYFCFNCVRVLDAARATSEPESAWLAKGVPDPCYPWEFRFGDVPRGTHAFRCLHRRDTLLVSSAVARVLRQSALVGWALVDVRGRVAGVRSAMAGG